MSDNYSAQKKYLSKQKQVRVWVDNGTYEQLKQIVKKNNTSIYAVVKACILNYIKESK